MHGDPDKNDTNTTKKESIEWTTSQYKAYRGIILSVCELAIIITS